MSRRTLVAPAPETSTSLYDLDCEVALLGSVMRDCEVLPKVAHVAGNFYREPNNEVFLAFLELAAAGEPIDIVSTAAKLRERGTLERVGGSAALASMQEAGIANNAEHYAGIVHELADRRRLKALVEETGKNLGDVRLDHAATLAHLNDELPRIGNGLWRSSVPKASVGVRLDTVTPEKVNSLWFQRMPLGKVGLIDSDPGLGKTSLSLDIAARLSRGALMPDGSKPGRAGGVVIVSVEDGLADTIVPRLLGAGADLTKIVALTTIPVLGAENRLIELPLDVDKLRDAARDVDAAFILIDPLVAVLPANVDSHRDQDVRRALAPLSTLAEELDCFVLCVRHLNKSSSAPALYRGGGSIAFAGIARTVMLVTKDPDDPDHRILSWLKNSLFPPQTSLRYCLDGSSGVLRVVWGGASAYSAEQLLASQGASEEERGALAEAKAWLEDYLTSGPVAASQAPKDALKAGIAPRTLERAKASLGVASRKTPQGWMWSTPQPKPVRTDPPDDACPSCGKVDYAPLGDGKRLCVCFTEF